MSKYFTILLPLLLASCVFNNSNNGNINAESEFLNQSIDTLVKQSESYYSSDSFSDNIFDKYLLKADSIATKYDLSEQKINIFNLVGKRYRHVAEFGHAIMYFQKAYALANRIDDHKLKAHALHNMAVAFRRIDDNGQALKLHFKVLEWAEMANDTFLIITSQNGIGNVYLSYKQYQQAINYFQKSLTILHNGYNNKLSEAINNNNAGDSWLLLGNTDSAKYYIEKSYEINKEINSTLGQAICLNGLGNIALQAGNYYQAIEHYKASLNLNQVGGKLYYVADNLKNLGRAYTKLNNFKLADKSLKEGLIICREIGSKAQAYEIFNILSELYNNYGKTPQAFDFLKSALIHKDSITEEVTKQNVEGMNAIYKSEKQEREIVILKQKTELDELYMTRQRIITFAALLFSLGGIVIALYIYRQLKQKQRFSKTIETQHKNITASIKYAEKIQTALLPSFDTISSRVKDYFVLFRPKNIVSGDFYWTTYVNNKTIIATADCTGHGVPGALMSMLGVSFLNEIVNNNGLTEPNLILDKLREQLIRQLHQKGEENTSKDGMDIAIYTINHDQMKLQYAGSYIPLYLIRNNNFVIIEPNKMPVGYHWKKNEPFTKQELELQNDDCIYSSSDGYYDQFGGENNSKFLIKNFKGLLLQIHKKPMAQQKDILDATIDKWKGSFEQIDDMIVIGIRV